MFFPYKPTKTLVIVSCLYCAVIPGCADDASFVDPFQARAKREAAMQQEGGGGQPSANAMRRDVLMPAMTSINTRIRAYEEKLKDWQDIERRSGTMGLPPEKLNRINACRSNLEHILLEYNALQKQLQQETRMDAAQLLAGNSLLLLNQQDIEYLESGCGDFLASLQQSQQAPPVVVAADPQIKAAFENNEYDQVINLYGQMMRTPGLTPGGETTFQYGQALVKNRQEMEALQVLSELLNRLRRQPGQDALLLQTLQLVADLQFTREAYEDARRGYEEVLKESIEKGARNDEWAGLQLAALQPSVVPTSELHDFGGLLRNYLRYVPKRDGFAVVEGAHLYLQQHPYTRLTPNVHLLSKNARGQADAWLNRGLNQADTTGGEQKPQDGQTVAVAAPPIVPAPPSVPVVAPPVQTEPPPATTDTIGTGNQGAVTPQPPVAEEKSAQDAYDKGMAYLQAKEYDRALERFNHLLNTPFDAKVRPMIAEASKQAGQELRQKAAELFVRASNSRDADEKRKLLLSARDLLQSILNKYPQSGLTEKVQRNLARIDADLRAVGAASAPQKPVTSGGAYVPPKAGGSSL